MLRLLVGYQRKMASRFLMFLLLLRMYCQVNSNTRTLHLLWDNWICMASADLWIQIRMCTYIKSFRKETLIAWGLSKEDLDTQNIRKDNKANSWGAQASNIVQIKIKTTITNSKSSYLKINNYEDKTKSSKDGFLSLRKSEKK